MVSEVESAGGKIDAVFFCPDLESDKSFNRKPNIGWRCNRENDFLKSAQTVHYGRRFPVGYDIRKKGRDEDRIPIINLPHIRRGYKTINYVFTDLLAFSKAL